MTRTQILRIHFPYMTWELEIKKFYCTADTEDTCVSISYEESEDDWKDCKHITIHKSLDLIELSAMEVKDFIPLLEFIDKENRIPTKGELIKLIKGCEIK